MNPVIVDNGGANMNSLVFALERLNAKPVISDDPEILYAASHIILPGVGHAADSMQKLKAKNLDRVVLETIKPVLGICLGMQLLYEHSTEGDTACLGLIEGSVKKFAQSIDLPCPHMGWNEVVFSARTDPAIALFETIENLQHFYFVHSFAAPVNAQALATTYYGQHIASAVAQDNYFGVQFHPERSGPIGSTLLNNFLRLS